MRSGTVGPGGDCKGVLLPGGDCKASKMLGFGIIGMGWGDCKGVMTGGLFGIMGTGVALRGIIVIGSD